MREIIIESVDHYNCPVAIAEAERDASPEDESLGVTVPQFYLKQVLDDGAGRQRRYICEKCGAEITINFPPNFP